MKNQLLTLLAALAVTNLMAYEANLNIDWKFAKGGCEIYGLDAALKANEQVKVQIPKSKVESEDQFNNQQPTTNNQQPEVVQVYDVDFDDAAWEAVSAPHCVNAHDTYDNHAIDAGDLNFYRGWMFYRKTIKVPQGKHFLLEFDTVRQSIYVYVNGKMAGYYEAGTAPTGYDITPYVKPGEAAQITVVMENTAGRGSKCVSCESKDKPGDWQGSGFQWCGSDFNPVQGGLIGNVTLHVKENDAYITLPLVNQLKTKGVYLWADDFDFAAGSATIHCEAEIFDGKQVRMAKADELAFEIDGKTYRGGVAKVSGLKFWSPDTPYLYDVKVMLEGRGQRVEGSEELKVKSEELRNGSSSGGDLSATHHSSLVTRHYREAIDSVTIRTGFRKVEFVKGKDLLFNGKQVWLPGYAQRATDSWAAIGFAPPWMQDFDADLIRQSGARFVRWMHITPKPAPVRAFDKYGVVNACPAGDKEGESSGRQWEQRVEAMEAALVYFRNSPSVVFWEAGNNQISPAHMREMRLLKEKIDPHGYRFMGCRTISSPEQIAEAEYVGTMIHRHDLKALESMKKVGKELPIMETEYCREESARRLWDRFTPPDFNFNCKRLSSGAKQRGYNCYDQTQEEYALSNAGTGDGYGYFYGNRASGRLGGNYVALAMLCWTDCNQHGRQSDTENCRSSGRVDAVRIPKENFYVHQVMYSQVPKVKILGHWNYPKKTADNYWYNAKVDDGKEITYTGERTQRDPEHKTVYVIGSLQVDHIELLVNGVSKGVAKKPEKLFDFAFPNVDITESGKVEAVAYDKDNKEIARDVIETVGEAAKLEMSVTTGPKGLLADGSDIAMIDLKLVDAQGRTLPLANNRVDFKMEFEGDKVKVRGEGEQRNCPSLINQQPTTNNQQPVFMGGWNSGTFDETSPVGKDWVNLECGVNRVFVKAGRAAGKITLKAVLVQSPDLATNNQQPTTNSQQPLEASVEIPVAAVTVTDGIAAEKPQARPMNAVDYTVANPVAPVRDLALGASAVEYLVKVNGEIVSFKRRTGGAFKPDASTGVVCPYVPVLVALTNAGAKVTFRYDRKKIQNKKLRQFCTNPQKPYFAWLQMKAGGKTVDAIAGLTVLFEDNGKDKNLTNYEMTVQDGALIGELGPLLGYIPGITVKRDDIRRVVSIEVKSEE